MQGSHQLIGTCIRILRRVDTPTDYDRSYDQLCVRPHVEYFQQSSHSPKQDNDQECCEGRSDGDSAVPVISCLPRTRYSRPMAPGTFMTIRATMSSSRFVRPVNCWYILQ